MIFPAFSCGPDYRANIKPNISLRLVTCPDGTYVELYHEGWHRPVKNGKLFMIDYNGELVLFENPNKIHTSIDPDTGCIEVEGGAE